MYISSEVAERVKNLAKSRGMKLGTLLRDAGLGSNTMANFKTSMPKCDTLAKIADQLGCSVDYLIGKEQKKEAVQTNGQEEDIDNEIMRLVEGMSLAQKQMVLLETYRLLQRQQKEEDASKNH